MPISPIANYIAIPTRAPLVLAHYGGDAVKTATLMSSMSAACAALELFSNPALGPSVTSWCDSLDRTQWRRLEHMDLSGCEMKDEGFEHITSALLAMLGRYMHTRAA